MNTIFFYSKEEPNSSINHIKLVDINSITNKANGTMVMNSS